MGPDCGQCGPGWYEQWATLPGGTGQSFDCRRELEYIAPSPPPPPSVLLHDTETLDLEDLEEKNSFQWTGMIVAGSIVAFVGLVTGAWFVVVRVCVTGREQVGCWLIGGAQCAVLPTSPEPDGVGRTSPSKNRSTWVLGASARRSPESARLVNVRFWVRPLTCVEVFFFFHIELV